MSWGLIQPLIYLTKIQTIKLFKKYLKTLYLTNKNKTRPQMKNKLIKFKTITQT